MLCICVRSWSVAMAAIKHSFKRSSILSANKTTLYMVASGAAFIIAAGPETLGYKLNKPKFKKVNLEGVTDGLYNITHRLIRTRKKLTIVMAPAIEL